MDYCVATTSRNPMIHLLSFIGCYRLVHFVVDVFKRHGQGTAPSPGRAKPKRFDPVESSR